MTNIRKIDVNLLCAFDALYDTHSVTMAADRLALTQPTVSGMLSRLRDLFGDRLFVRTQYGILPTPRAEQLSDPIKAVLADIEALVAPEHFDPATLKTTISLSANDYMQQSLVVPLISTLRKKAPGIKLAVLPAYIAGLAENLAKGKADVALTIPEFASDDLARKLLYTEHYVCVARKSHPLDEKQISLEDFCRFDHVVVSPTGGSFAGPVDQALSNVGAKRNVSLSLPSFHVLLEAIRSNDLLAHVPKRLLVGRMASLKVFAPPVIVPDFDVIMCWHQRLEHDQMHRWLRSLIFETALRISQ